MCFCVAARIAVESLEKAITAVAPISGKNTGLASLDEQLGGLCDGELILFAGRPGIGKTSLAATIAFNVANQLRADRTLGTEPEQTSGAAVTYFSLQMSADRLASHILAQVSGVNAELVLSGGISQAEFQRVAETSQRMADLPLFIDGTAALTVFGLCARAKMLKRRHDIGLIIVDDLRLLQGMGTQPSRPIGSSGPSPATARAGMQARRIDYPPRACTPFELYFLPDTGGRRIGLEPVLAPNFSHPTAIQAVSRANCWH